MIRVDKDNRGFKPTIEWMRIMYHEMNNVLFGGMLGECDFEIFTNGKGSEGRTLGRFSLRSSGLKYERFSRRIFQETYNDVKYVSHRNFYEICNPMISLNGNYTGTEYGFLGTLIHEMCHYYTYMEGYVPKQGHGREFYQIGDTVSMRSGGLYTIERLASAEEMRHFDLSDEMKAKSEKRMLNKKSNIYALFDYRSDNDIHLTTTSSQELINQICDFNRNRLSKQVVITNDKRMIDLLFERGYKKNFRTWRYWPVAGGDVLNMLNSVEKDVLINNNSINENKRSIDYIINETINKFIIEKFSADVCNITPDMDLGLYSPLEIE